MIFHGSCFSILKFGINKIYEIFLSQKGYPENKSVCFGFSLCFMHFKPKHSDGSYEAFQNDRIGKTLVYNTANQLLPVIPWFRGGGPCANY